MLEINDGTNYLNVFNNITEVADYVTTKQRKSGRGNSSEGTGDYYFYGTRNFDEAIDFLKYGDEDLYNRVKEEKSKINIDKILGNARKRQTYENKVYGCVPNVPAYLIGTPLNMINSEIHAPSQKIINIFLNTRVSGEVDKDDVIKIGTKYLSIIDILEKQGYRCNLYSGCANSSWSGRHCYMLVRVKTDREPLNIKKICFTIANPSMQRRIKFRWMEVNDFDHDFTGGYGQHDDISYTTKILNEKLKDNFIVWNYEDAGSSKSIEKMIEDLKKQGINIQ